MKKILISFTCLILILSSIVLATETPKVEVDENMLTSNPSTVDTDNGVMPISTEGDEIAETQETIKYEDIARIEDNIEISNNVYGDIYLIGKNVDISSNYIEGNIFIMADKVKIQGNIEGYVYIMATDTEILGTVKGAYIISENINVGEYAYVVNGLKTINNSLNLKGTIYRNLYSISNNINIEKNENNPNVFGSIYYTGNLNAEEGLVSGEKIKYEVSNNKINIKDEIITILSAIVSTLIIISIIIALQKDIECNKKLDIKGYLKNIGIGLATLIVIPIISVLLMITEVALPIGILLLTLYFVGIYISLSIASIVIAKNWFKDNMSKINKIGISILVYIVLYIIKYIPIVGFIIRILAILLGLGLIVSSLLCKLPKKENKEKVDEKIDEN